MIKTTVYMLWDENEGYRNSKVYSDIESAKIALEEHYTEYWIHNTKAKIESIDLVSYINEKFDFLNN